MDAAKSIADLTRIVTECQNILNNKAATDRERDEYKRLYLDLAASLAATIYRSGETIQIRDSKHIKKIRSAIEDGHLKLEFVHHNYPDGSEIYLTTSMTPKQFKEKFLTKRK